MTINYVGGPLVVLLISWTSISSLLLILTANSAPANPGYLISSNVLRFVEENLDKTNQSFTFEKATAVAQGVSVLQE